MQSGIGQKRKRQLSTHEEQVPMVAPLEVIFCYAREVAFLDVFNGIEKVLNLVHQHDAISRVYASCAAILQHMRQTYPHDQIRSKTCQS